MPLDLKIMTMVLYQIPFKLGTPLPDPMLAPFVPFEKYIDRALTALWDYREEWKDVALPPIWKASLRMTVMYLNMSEAFFECGQDLLLESMDEAAFTAKHINNKGKTRLARASKLLARCVVMLRTLGFKSPLISIGGDHHYNGRCQESRACLAALER